MFLGPFFGSEDGLGAVLLSAAALLVVGSVLGVWSSSQSAVPNNQAMITGYRVLMQPLKTQLNNYRACVTKAVAGIKNDQKAYNLKLMPMSDLSMMLPAGLGVRGELQMINPRHIQCTLLSAAKSCESLLFVILAAKCSKGNLGMKCALILLSFCRQLNYLRIFQAAHLGRVLARKSYLRLVL